MTAPVFVNASALTSTTGTSLGLTLPASRVNGNFLIAFISVNSPSSADVTWPAGWTPLDSLGGAGNAYAGFAYCYVTGSETAPTVSWSASATVRGAIMQFSGVRATMPIGNKTKNMQGATATITCPAMTTSEADSLAFGFVFANTGTINAPAGWTARVQLTTNLRQTGMDKLGGPAGTSTGAISITATVSNSHSFIFELIAATKTLFLTSGSSWTVPSDWNSASNSIEVIGGGGGGMANIPNNAPGRGAGGGAYSKITNLALTSGAAIPYAVGAAGAGETTSALNNSTSGGDTWFNGATFAAASVAAKGGQNGRAGGAAGAGASGIGATKWSGGLGGASSGHQTDGGAGGGGAGGPTGNGGAGTPSNSFDSAGKAGGAGGTGGTGAGGTAGPAGGGTGGGGTNFDATHGAGGGGGGGNGMPGSSGGAAGLYGGGGGGSGDEAIGGNFAGGNGTQGLIVITYLSNPIPPAALTAVSFVGSGVPVVGTPVATTPTQLTPLSIATGSPVLGTPSFPAVLSAVSITHPFTMVLGSPTLHTGLPPSEDNALLGPAWSSSINNVISGPYTDAQKREAVALVEGDSVDGPFKIWTTLVKEPAEIVYMFEIEAKQGGRFIEMGLGNIDLTTHAWAVFDPKTGGVIYQGSLGKFHIYGIMSEPLTNGFYRFTLAATSDLSTGVQAYVQLVDETLAADYEGNGVSGVLLCRPKLKYARDDTREFRWTIGPPEMRFYWTIHPGEMRLQWFRASQSQAGVDPHLRIGRMLDLECVFQRWKPAHTEIVFDYGGALTGTADPMAGTP